MIIGINADKILKNRITKGFSQSELANIASVSVLTIRSLESGVIKKPHAYTIKKICAALDLNPLEVYRFS